jgi:invasion protein IalB
MAFSSRALGLAAAASIVALSAMPAFAQEGDAPKPAAPQGQSVALKADPSQSEWVKLCGKDQQTQNEICFTQRSFVTETNQPVLAMAVYDSKNAKQQYIRFILPLGFMLERGMRYTIDQQKPVPGKFQICLPNGCFAEVKLDAGVLKGLKGGKAMKIEVQNQFGQPIAFTLPLEGFSKGFDGPAIDPKVIEEQNKKLEAELAKRVEEQKKLLQQQGAPANPQ